MTTGPYVELETPSGPKRFALGDGPFTIGRHPDNALVIQDDRASRFHCTIECEDGDYRLRDLESRNGTKVNEKRVSEARLQTGDRFRIGKTRFTFVDPAATPIPLSESAADESNEHAVATAARETPRKTRRSSQSSNKRPSDPLLVGADDDSTDYNALLGDLTSDKGPGDYEGGLRKMATAGAASRDVENENIIALIDAHGRVVHASVETGDDAERTSEATRLLRVLLWVAMRTRTTDIHLEPKADDYQTRIRVDGTMVDAERIPKEIAQRVNGVVKVLCEIDLSKRNVIQEGHFSSRVADRRVDYRVSFTPSMYGQKLVIRVLDLANAPQFLKDLHLPNWMFETIRRVSRQDAGMILACGPTGSGKTTSLYSVLRDIDTEQRNVITIEDPVEYQIEGVTQIPIEEGHGNTFATLLRSVLRQDPDVLLVGEIRDNATAQTAMQAAMTGHLVLSTLHAKDTIGSIFRLLDLDIEPYLVASGLNLVLAQRLIRLLCPNCKIDKKPTPQQTLQMGRYVEGVNEVWFPVGCDRCLRTGYLGRRAIFETLLVTDEMRDVILKSPTIQAIREAIRMTMFQSLSSSGYNYVLDGTTSIEEVERVVGTE